MENFAHKLENLFEEKFLLYKMLNLAVEQEKNYIVDMDVDSLWKMTDRKNQLASEIVQIRNQILCLLKDNKVLPNMELKSFNLVDIITGLPFPSKMKSGLKKIKTDLDIVKRDLESLASENRRYTNEYLSVINGIFTTIISSENREQYTNSGLISKDNEAKSLIRAEV